MDPRARIDYALFHLTPTRTRCDLVIFADGQSEKLASGLLQPFLLHLNCAKEQIQKGGYSITLAPPAPAAWFTKATLQRFVRFVSSPEVLERFVTIEKEIEQIEESIRSNELACEEADSNGKEASADETQKKTASASQRIDEINGADNAAQGEHSKVRLLRVLETRKAVLHKEQAMAYARALVTGFQPSYLDALVSFADAFGASRLRDACCNFIELCKKKNQDRLWMAEVAAMQASQSQLSYSGTSGIVLADDENGAVQYPVDPSAPNQASDQSEMNGKPQPLSPWANHYPQYFPNYYGPIHPQNMPPYQGYPFPGMRVGNPYFPGNMMSDSGLDRKNKSSIRKKGKLSQEKAQELDAPEQDVSGGSSLGSALEESTEHSPKKKTVKKESRKKSKKVVIRNINYISSRKDGARGSSSEAGSSDDGEPFDGDSIKQQIEEAVGSLNRHRRQKKQVESKHAANGSNGHAADMKGPGGEKMAESWGAFQSILMRDREMGESAVNPVLVEKDISVANGFDQIAEGAIRQRVASSDAFVVSREVAGDGDGMRYGDFDSGESYRSRGKNSNGADEMMMLARGAEGQGNFVRSTQSDYAYRSSVVKSRTGEDWFIKGSSSVGYSSDRKVLVGEGEYASSVAKDKNGIIDDSFMVQGHSDQRDSELKTDLSMVLDVTNGSHQPNGACDEPEEKREAAKSFEPDDLYMVLDRSASTEHFMASWTPEIDYESRAKVSEADKKPNAEDDQNQTAKAKGKVVAGKDPRSKALGGAIGRSKAEVLSRTRKPPPPGTKTTVVRKSKQQLEEERKRRMEDLLIQRQKRIAERKANSVTDAASKKESAECKRSVKREKPLVKSSTQGKKPIMKNSTIDRLAAARISKPVAEAQSKMSQTRKASAKAGKDAGNRTKKLAPSKEKGKPSDKKYSGTVLKGVLASNSDVSEKMDEPGLATDPPEAPTPTVDSLNNEKKADDLDGYNSVISEEKDSNVVKVTSVPAPTPAADEAEEVKELPTRVPQEAVISPIEASTDSNGNVSSLAVEEATSDPPDQGVDKQSSAKATISRTSDSNASNTKQARASSVTFAAVTTVSEIQVSTPPSSIRLSPESLSRKKWDSSDSSTKVARGLKKLLMFGRKSRPISYA